MQCQSRPQKHSAKIDSESLTPPFYILRKCNREACEVKMKYIYGCRIYLIICYRHGLYGMPLAEVREGPFSTPQRRNPLTDLDHT